jgi:hypothetical protein
MVDIQKEVIFLSLIYDEILSIICLITALTVCKDEFKSLL